MILKRWSDIEKHVLGTICFVIIFVLSYIYNLTVYLYIYNLTIIS